MNTAADFFILFAVGLSCAGIGIWIGVRSERAYWTPRCKELLAEIQRLTSCMKAMEAHQQRQARFPHQYPSANNQHRGNA